MYVSHPAGKMPEDRLKRPLLHIPYVYIKAMTFTLPFVSLLTVVTLGVFFHMDQVTSTHCNVSLLKLNKI